jgi:hypothetical protein
MPKLVAPESVETVSETPVNHNSKKREVTAMIVAGVVSVALGAVATGVISRASEAVRNRIAPPKPEAENTDDE